MQKKRRSTLNHMYQNPALIRDSAWCRSTVAYTKVTGKQNVKTEFSTQDAARIDGEGQLDDTGRMEKSG